MSEPRFQWIKGAGDIASAVAHALRVAGLRPILQEREGALVLRRRMAFGGALFEGEATLEGLRGVRCDGLAAALDCLGRADCVPVLVWEAAEAPPPGANVMVDARMRKKEAPPVQIGQAALTIGIGPGFEAGRQVHAVVESNWGDALGQVVWQGGAAAYTGRHRVVEGHGSARYLYAPAAGTFRTSHEILAPVAAGECVARVGEAALCVEIGGILRGLAHDGIAVAAGAKVVEVEPRGEARFCEGIGQRPRAIAAGVLAAVREKVPELF